MVNTAPTLARASCRTLSVTMCRAMARVNPPPTLGLSMSRSLSVVSRTIVKILGPSASRSLAVVMADSHYRAQSTDLGLKVLLSASLVSAPVLVDPPNPSNGSSRSPILVAAVVDHIRPIIPVEVRVRVYDCRRHWVRFGRLRPRPFIVRAIPWRPWDGQWIQRVMPVVALTRIFVARRLFKPIPRHRRCPR